MIHKSYNILIVEDEWVNAVFIEGVLESFGHTVVSIVTSAEEALSALKECSVEFIFMDINIQGSMDGIQLAHTINELQEIPIIFMTAFGDSNTIFEASQSNIYGFIIKPFNESDVEATLNVAIARIQKESSKILKSNDHTNEILILPYNYRYHFKKKILTLNDETVIFSKNEAQLMHLFCLHYEEIVGMDNIRSYVWGSKEISESAMRETILRIRKKIPQLTLQNIIGIGYALKKGHDG